jgi:hypothetical protein
MCVFVMERIRMTGYRSNEKERNKKLTTQLSFLKYIYIYVWLQRMCAGIDMISYNLNITLNVQMRATYDCTWAKPSCQSMRTTRRWSAETIRDERRAWLTYKDKIVDWRWDISNDAIQRTGSCIVRERSDVRRFDQETEKLTWKKLRDSKM